MSNTHFVYCPQSGSKFLPGSGPRENITVPCVVWDNRSAHVVGTLLDFNTTMTPYWREAAREAAARVAVETGGVAWDERGSVCLVVDPSQSHWALRAMMLAKTEANGYGECPSRFQPTDISRLSYRIGLSLEEVIGPSPADPEWDWQYIAVGGDFRFRRDVLGRVGRETARVKSPWGMRDVFGAGDASEYILDVGDRRWEEPHIRQRFMDGSGDGLPFATVAASFAEKHQTAYAPFRQEVEGEVTFTGVVATSLDFIQFQRCRRFDDCGAMATRVGLNGPTCGNHAMEAELAEIAV